MHHKLQSGKKEQKLKETQVLDLELLLLPLIVEVSFMVMLQYI